MSRWPPALKELGQGVATGKLKYRETVAEGLAAAPAAFISLLKGGNLGKQLVKLMTMSKRTPAPARSPKRTAFDTGRLAAWLKAHVEGFSGELQVEQFKGGQSNPTFMLSAGGRKYVMRRKPPGKLLPSAHAVDREYKVITALAKTDVPVAKTYALCTDDASLAPCLLHHGLRRRPHPVGPGPAGHERRPSARPSSTR
jgi:hypothetical protein